MNRNNFFLIVCALLFITCKSEKPAEYIEFDFFSLDKEDFFTAETFSEMSYIQLDSNANCLIGNEAQLVYQNGWYFIKDQRPSPVHVFDSSGRYAISIGKVGRGMGEYLFGGDFLVDTHAERIEILDGLINQKIFCYDMENNFIYDMDVKSYAYSFIKDNNYWFCKGLTSDRSLGTENIYELSPEGKILKKYLSDDKIVLSHPMPGKHLVKGTDHNYYWSFLENVIYIFSEDTLKPYIQFDFGSLAFPEKIFLKSQSEIARMYNEESHLSIRQFLENKSYLYFYIVQTGETHKFYHLLYNKKNKRILFSEIVNKEVEQFFWEAKYITEDNELIFILNPFDLKQFIDQRKIPCIDKPFSTDDNANCLLVKMKISSNN